MTRGGKGRGVVGDGERVNALMGLEDFRRLEDIVSVVSEGGGGGNVGMQEEVNVEAAAAGVELTATTTQQRKKRIVIIGGGFLGTEISLSLASRARAHQIINPLAPPVEIVQVYAERDPLISYLPAYLARDVKRRIGRRGVKGKEGVVVTDMRVEEMGEKEGEDNQGGEWGRSTTRTTRGAKRRAIIFVASLLPIKFSASPL